MAMRRKRRRGASLHCAARPVPDVAREIARRPGVAHHRAADRSVSVRGHPLVFDAVRPRRHRHRAAAALARRVARARRAAVPGREPGAGDIGLRRRRAGQDPARDAPGRAGGDRRSAVSRATTAASTRRRCSCMLAGAYARRTGDLAFIDQLWPALEAAMAWIDGAGDSNGDGFVDYARANRIGLVNQGWKDSIDSIFHADGTMAEPPIALVEVQGYVYAARRAMAWLAERRGDAERAQELAAAREGAARRGREALLAARPRLLRDRDRRHGASRAACARRIPGTCSTPACLRRSARRASSSSCCPRRSTTAGACARSPSDQARFNPMSYHNGSVWPHDTALCAAGHGGLRRSRRGRQAC